MSLKKKNCIYVICFYPIFNNKAVPVFEKLSLTDSALLYSHLLTNFFELFAKTDLKFDVVFCLDKRDENHIPGKFFPEGSKILINTSENYNSNLEHLAKNFFSSFENNLLIRSDVLGISEKYIRKIFNLLAIEDEVLVIGKSINKKVTFLGINNLELNLVDKIFSTTLDYDKFLIQAIKKELLLHTLIGFQLIENFDDFKRLYNELSKKESLDYCSEHMHERFTNLFIEYKDLLNE